MPAGSYIVQWIGLDDQGRSMPAGTCLYHIETGDFQDTKKLIKNLKMYFRPDSEVKKVLNTVKYEKA